jgi:hypothetical protein
MPPAFLQLDLPERATRASGNQGDFMHRTTIIVAVGFALVAALPTAPAKAGAARTFVSPTGSDSNLCTLVAPCRYLQAALAQTNAGGEISILGTAGYNNGATLIIDKAINIVNPGGFQAGIIVPSGGTGIVINAGTYDVVTLRGLTIDGAAVGTTGIIFNSGASLTITNSTIHNLLEHGVVFQPSANAKLFVSDALITDLGSVGVYVKPKGGNALAAVNHVQIHNAYWGVISAATQISSLQVTVTDSIVANGQYGFGATAPGGGSAFLQVTGSTLAQCMLACIYASGWALVEIGHSNLDVANGLQTAVQIDTPPAAVYSYGNNHISGYVVGGVLQPKPTQ